MRALCNTRPPHTVQSVDTQSNTNTAQTAPVGHTVSADTTSTAQPAAAHHSDHRPLR